MFSHIMIGANDLSAMVVFYDKVLAQVGLTRTTSLDQVGPAGVIWQEPKKRWPQFALRTPINGLSATAGNGVQVSFRCKSSVAVDKAWKEACRNGGSDEGAPGNRPVYHEDFYAAYARDPEGNSFAFCSVKNSKTVLRDSKVPNWTPFASAQPS